MASVQHRLTAGVAVAAKRAIKGAIAELSQERPHTQGVERLLKDTSPVDLFDLPDGPHSAIATFEAVLL